MVKTANSPSCPIPEYLLVSLKVGIRNGCIKNIPLLMGSENIGIIHNYSKYGYALHKQSFSF